MGLTLGIAISFAALAALNTAERKAAREAQTVADETAGRVMKACGNERFKFDFDWTGFKELDYTVGGFSREEAIRRAGDRANRIGNAMIAVCGNPQALKAKAGLSALTQVRLTPQTDEKNFRIDFQRLDSATLLARFGAFGVNVGEDLTAEIRKLF